MSLAHDGIQFVSDCSTPTFHNLAASDNRLPACFPFIGGVAAKHGFKPYLLAERVGFEPTDPEGSPR